MVSGNASLELDRPSAPVSLKELENSLYEASKQPKYSPALNAAQLRGVQRRCAAAQARGLPPVTESVWTEARTDPSSEPNTQDSGVHDTFSKMPPPAFRFHTYDHLPLYLQTTSYQDQDTIGSHPKQFSQPSLVETQQDHLLILQISVYTRRRMALTRKSRTSTSTQFGQDFESNYIPQLEGLDGELTLSQRVQLTNQHTLADFVQEMVCRNAEVPERADKNTNWDLSNTYQYGHWTGANDGGQQTDYPLYTGAMLETDLCLLIEQELYGKLDRGAEDSYVRALLADDNSGLPLSTRYGGTLDTQFRDLPAISFQQPYYLLHVGDCEHLWTLDWARPPMSLEHISLYPRTTSIKRWMQSSLARQYYAPKKLVVRGDQGIPCEICGGMRDASVAILGGDQVQSREKDKTRLNGMAQIVTYCCDACTEAALGSQCPSQDAPRPWTIVPLVGKGHAVSSHPVASGSKPQSLAIAQIDDVRRRLAKEAVRRNPKHLAEACRLARRAVHKNNKSPVTVDLQHETYELLLDVLAERGCVHEALLVLEDIEASGLDITPKEHELAMKAAAENGDEFTMRTLLKRAGSPETSIRESESDVLCFSQWTAKAYAYAFLFCTKSCMLELALALWFTAREQRITLSEESMFHLFECLDQAREPQLAHEIAVAYDSQSPSIWMEVLRIAARCDYAPALNDAWTRSRPYELDRGLYVQAMLAASRAGNADLIHTLLDHFARFYRGEKPQPWHLALAFEGYARAGALPAAFQIAELARKLHGGLDIQSYASLASYAASSDSNLKDAIQAILTHRPIVPTPAWNALLYATAERENLSQAMRILTKWEDDPKFQPNLETYNAFLMCCIATGNRDIGQRAWTHLMRSGLTPSVSLYESIARLQLTQIHYEDAFHYLEQIKQMGSVPSHRMYAAMMWTCLKNNDQRWRTLLQEMKEADYEPGERLQSAINAADT
ncbi:hypothetical protein MYAM1_003537 [Malassezia yamatoensis]|uniref:Pentatricopeptide repeat-containing protein-mitochondrial domain-containing protein n=1 Tax=Malassezia yamatoensis TaxID=253288 RepID=A0AAJ6CIB0_9BASI|nr:hypothetical protein MYAM1_003537 [Malassezia yamatoensis]